MTPQEELEALAISRIPARAFAEMVAELEPEEQDRALRARFRFDLESFCRYCWPDRFYLPFSELHHKLFEQSAEPGWRSRAQNIQDALAAPRGYAKSTLSCFAQPIHAMLYDLEACIVMLSAGQRLALAQVKDIKTALEDEESPLAQLYGPIDTAGSLSEFLVSVDGAPPAAILPGSFGSDVRGWKHPTRGIRPTLVIVDDGEKKDRVRSPEQRRIWWDFLTKDVLKLGPREGGTRYWVRGTVLHVDSMLAKALNHPGWRSNKWKAIISWPDHPELWEECGRIWANLADPERRENALAFYADHELEMDEGVEVLDPDAETIFDLYEQIWGGGLGSFLQEKQNDPRDPTAAIFLPEKFARCRIKGVVLLTADGRTVPLSSITRRYIRWDPAMGDASGDFAAIVVCLRDKHGYTYVVDAWMRKAKPSDQLAALWPLAERWGVARVSLESNGFQQLLGETFRRQRADRREAGKFWRLEVVEEPSTTNKEERIAGLEPDCHNGWIQFAESLPVEGIQQFGDFPSGGHDDFPDAVEGAWARMGGRQVSVERDPAARLF